MEKANVPGSGFRDVMHIDCSKLPRTQTLPIAMLEKYRISWDDIAARRRTRKLYTMLMLMSQSDFTITGSVSMPCKIQDARLRIKQDFGFQRRSLSVLLLSLTIVSDMDSVVHAFHTIRVHASFVLGPLRFEGKALLKACAPLKVLDVLLFFACLFL